MIYPAKVQQFLDEFEPAPYASSIVVASAKENIHKLEKQIAELSDELFKRRSGLTTMCPHSNKTVDSMYFEGSYLDRAYTAYTVICTDCGKRLFEYNDQHSWYG